MKKVIPCTGLLIVLSFSLTTCNKIDWGHVWHGPGQRDCRLISYILSEPASTPQPFLFTKKYNHAGDLTEIDCRFNNIVIDPEFFPHYRLRIKYDNKKAYLINMNSPYDTSMTLFFNNQGRVEKAMGDEVLLDHTFTYRQNKLYSVSTDFGDFTTTDTCEYDTKGNILHIARRDAAHHNERVGYHYQYDYSKKGKYQFYLEETITLANGFTLLQYLDLFPELAPVNLRIHSKNGLENGSSVWNMDLANHQVDSKGRLLKYDAVSRFNGQTFIILDATLNWNCK